MSFVVDAINIKGSQLIQVSVSAAAAQSDALEPGVYDVSCDVDCYLRVAEAATGVTTSNGYPLYAGNAISLRIVGPSDRVGVIAAGAGTLRLHKVG